jgi:hypothetical protein
VATIQIQYSKISEIQLDCSQQEPVETKSSIKLKTNIKSCILNVLGSRDSSVGIALGYGMDDRGPRIRFPAGAGNFSFHHRVQNGSRAHTASYPMGTRGTFPGGKAAGA